MKMLTAISLLMIAITSFASSESKTFYFDGSQSSVMMSLRAEETHTEYRYEQRRSICYRQEVFYTTHCTSSPRGRSCQTIPHYRTISYPCIETVRIPYEVKDYDVEAEVELKIAALPGATHGETFRVTLNGDFLSVSAMSSGSKYFVLLQNKEISSSMNGSVKFIDASYSASFVEAAPVLKALDVSNISLKNSTLSFTTGPVGVREFIGFHLNVKKAPVLGSDTVLFDRELRSSEIQLASSESASSAEVNIQKLGVSLTSGRYSLTAKTFFKFEGALINSSQFEKTSAERTLIYKIR